MFPLVPLLIASLGGLFVGSQVDNAVQASASKPAIIDNSKMPWYVTLAICAVVALIAWQFIKKAIK